MLWQTKWLSRFVLLIVAFGFIRYIAVNLAASLIFGQAMQALNERLASAETVQDIAEILHDRSAIRSIMMISGLSLFVAATINSIASYGLSRVRLSAAAGEAPASWVKMSFSGFSDPFGMLALGVLHSLFVWWPVFLVVAPAFAMATGVATGEILATGTTSPYLKATLPFTLLCIVPFYRYRQAWFIKAAHPDYSAIKCLRESAALMRGNKVRNFLLDCAFWRPVTLFLAVIFTAAISAVAGASAVTLLAATLISMLSLYLSAYVPLAQAIFHLQLCKAKGDEK